MVRSTRLELVRVSPHAPQTCAYADSATTARCINSKGDYICRGLRCQAEKRLKRPTLREVRASAVGHFDGERMPPDVVADIQVTHGTHTLGGLSQQHTADLDRFAGRNRHLRNAPLGGLVRIA